jgi:hypothetical protein
VTRRLPVTACPRPLAARRRRGLPVPVHTAYASVPSSPTPEGPLHPVSTYSVAAAWPSAVVDGVGSPHFVVFEALLPGPLACSPTLQPRGRPRSRKGWLSRGRDLPGAGLVDSFALLSSPASVCRFLPALSDHDHDQRDVTDPRTTLPRDS